MKKMDVVISRLDLEKRIKELGVAISQDYEGKELVVIGILNGAFVFMADLVRSVVVPHEIDFIRVSSYGDDTSSSGVIRLSKDVEINVAEKHVLLVEDIVDTGATLAWLSNHFSQKKAASVRICTLIDKFERRKNIVSIDYHGFSIDHGFLVGYGLDYAERYRHLPEMCTFSE